MFDNDSSSGGDFSLMRDNKFGFKEIALMYLNKILYLAVVEFRGGYWTTTENEQGKRQEIYVPDTREKFNNALRVFTALIYPRLIRRAKSDPNVEKIKLEIDKYFVSLKTNEKLFLESNKFNNEVVFQESVYTLDNDKVLLELYKIQKLELYLNLFGELSMFLEDENYFQTGSMTME